jgi:deoxyadenosine/deoxycytidine kinase
MDDRDWENYRNLFKVMISFLRKPDLIIYLKASTDTLLTRIKKRARDYEKTIDPEYLHTLNISYDKWIANIKDIPVLTVDTNNFNIFEDQKTLQSIIKDINNKLK